MPEESTMAIGLVMEETMSGWIRIEGEGGRHPFSFSIRAYTDKIFRIGAIRCFKGIARFGDYHRAVPVTGELQIFLSGPRYSLDLVHDELGPLHIEGKKEYGKNGLIRSLVTCPLKVYRDGGEIGEAEAAYRDPIWSYPFRALRLVREENAFGSYERA
jgi:hypothetical protein